MRAQHQTTMTVHVRKLNRGMKQASKTTKAGPRGGISKRIQEISNFMRPKRTFFRAERVRVVPPERESPPQAPPEALPAAGVRRRVFF
jgi:hypothetical protein